MNLTMVMTLDGLIRALRWKEHDLAERVERRVARRDALSTARQPASPGLKGPRRGDDDRRDR